MEMWGSGSVGDRNCRRRRRRRRSDGRGHRSPFHSGAGDRWARAVAGGGGVPSPPRVPPLGRTLRGTPLRCAMAPHPAAEPWVSLLPALLLAPVPGPLGFWIESRSPGHPQSSPPFPFPFALLHRDTPQPRSVQEPLLQRHRELNRTHRLRPDCGGQRAMGATQPNATQCGLCPNRHLSEKAGFPFLTSFFGGGKIEETYCSNFKIGGVGRI